MMHLLTLEWKKFRKNSVVTLLALFFLLFTPAGIFTLNEFEGGNINPLLPSKNTFFSFSGIWEYLGYTGSWTVFFFLGVIVIYIICSEVAYKTERQSMINGLTRSIYFRSKLYSILAIAIFATLYYTIWALVIGAINTDNYDIPYMFDNEWAISRFFLMCLGYFSFAMLVSFWLRKSGLAIFVYFTYIMIMEPILRWFVHTKIFDGASSRYYPLNAVEDLMPMPFWKIAEKFPMKDIDFEPLLSYSHAAMVTGVATIVFVGLSWWLFNKRDL